jgi:hypothetical protein
VKSAIKMKNKYESKETYIATLQIESDYTNLVIYLDELEVLKKDTKKSKVIKAHCVNLIESIIRQKEILDINKDAELDLLFELKYNER